MVEVPEGRLATAGRGGGGGGPYGLWSHRGFLVRPAGIRPRRRPAWSTQVPGRTSWWDQDKPCTGAPSIRTGCSAIPDSWDYQGHEETLALLQRPFPRAGEASIASAGERGARQPADLLFTRYLVAAYGPAGSHTCSHQRIEAIETAEDRFKYPGPGETPSGSSRLFRDLRGRWPPPPSNSVSRPPLAAPLRVRAAWHPSQAFSLQADGRLAMTLTVSLGRGRSLGARLR